MAKTAHPEGLMSVSEYADHGGVHKSTISRQLKSGIIRNQARPGKRPLIDPIQADRRHRATTDRDHL